MCAVALVAWLIAVAAGRDEYAVAQVAIGSWLGKLVLFAFTFSLTFHLCAGIRHLVWDAGYGFELRSIYLSGWAVVLTSATFTVVVWACAYALGTQ
jgi:succinate dehydrogenase / fumarate reductase cytochrome b subunit